jgi:precorrin-4 methylase/DMSO/TMAO reductase YedYZ molybdopterin-dependent catalytic subunit
MKRFVQYLFAALALIALSLPSASHALTVGGSVRQPLNLSAATLAQLGTTEVRLTDLTREKKYGGVFVYRGIPLRNILEMAAIEKDGPGFTKTTDLAIAVRTGDGWTTVLSWGEVFYRNPSNAVIALSATPVTPHHSEGCGECHAKSFYQPTLDRLKRKIGFPKLVLGNDFYSDRSMEDVVAIEVVDLKREAAKKDVKPSTARFSITDIAGRNTEFTEISAYPRKTVDFKNVGDGRGYHGSASFEGVPLRELLGKIDGGREMDRAILVTSTDGYRAAFSFGEIFLAPLGERIIISENRGEKPGEQKKFTLVSPDDEAADRMVKTVSRIEVISLKEQPKLYVISMGCGDPSLLTLEAVSAMGKADAFIVSEGMAKQFAAYLGGKPVLFDPMLNFEPVFRKKNPGLSPEEVKKRLEANRAADMKKIRDALAAGKSVALLDHGDPTIYGGWQHWIEPEVGGRFEVITGVSAFNAANAMFANGKIYTGISAYGGAAPDNLLCNRGNAVITSPRSLAANEGLLKTVATSGDTVAVFMGLGELDTLEPLLRKYYPETAPMAIAYKAGYTKDARIVRTTLRELRTVAEKEGEKMMGMVYIGSCIK